MKYGERRSGHARLRLAVPSALPATMRGKVVELRSLYTAPAHRGQGHATRLLEAVTAEADRTGYFLFLAVEPKGEISAIELAQFYRKHGFLPIQPEPLLMVRPNAGSGMQTPPLPEKGQNDGAI